ncbi:MAG: hypothetical protein FIB04_12565 [Gammaproteobacteria bacterium]|nr:hypothetical protein [Gammaproteobacteria bacterium]
MSISATAAAEAVARAHSNNSFAQLVDRWIYVFMAASFIAYTLLGFIPDSIAKLAAVHAGQRPPFPPVLHAHAVLMGAFLLLLLAQSFLAATGRLRYHRTLGIAAFVIGPALVIAGVILVPTMYQQVWHAAQAAPPGIRSAIEHGLREFDNIMLVQIRVGVLFPIFLAIALAARKSDPGLHKRMMFLAVAIALPAAFDRMSWLPSSLPGSPLTLELYPLLAIAPMFAWDLVRTRSVHKAYVIWALVSLPFAILVHTLWNSEWWHATARQLVGV